MFALCSNTCDLVVLQLVRKAEGALRLQVVQEMSGRGNEEQVWGSGGCTGNRIAVGTISHHSGRPLPIITMRETCKRLRVVALSAAHPGTVLMDAEISVSSTCATSHLQTCGVYAAHL